jgi:hypothetical protein
MNNTNENDTPSNVTNIPAQPESESPQLPGRKPLNPVSAAQLAHAVGRYYQLSESLQLVNGNPTCIITPFTATQVAEHAGLQKHLQATLVSHAGELLGCYNIVRTEYEPLLRSIATVFGRIGLGSQAQTQPAEQSK